MRNVLRFPVGRQFKKILEDDHEWFIITDANLKPLVVKRSPYVSRVPGKMVGSMYIELYKSLPQGKSIRVYDLHTHPGIGNSVPSEGDIGPFIKHKKALSGAKIIVIGFGIITPYGISILKLPEDHDKLDHINSELKTEYPKQIKRYIKNRLGQKTWKGAVEHASENLNEPSKENLVNQAYHRTFQNIINAEPNASVRTIRRHTRRRMRR
jgi:hypothetical protein